MNVLLPMKTTKNSNTNPRQVRYIVIADEVITKKMSNPFDRLSDREFEVMILLLQGKSLTDIGAEISIQVSTVGTHKTRLFDKLNVSSLMELSKIASAYEIIS